MTKTSISSTCPYDHAYDPSVKRRFDSKWWLDPDTGCWNWHNVRPNGRATVFWMEYNHVIAARAAWILYRDEPLDHWHVLHTCDNARCVNPDHLWLGTSQENTQDMYNKGRSKTVGSLHPVAKLNEESVAEIKQIILDHPGRKDQAIGDMFGVQRSTIRAIRLNLSWTRVPWPSGPSSKP